MNHTTQRPTRRTTSRIALVPLAAVALVLGACNVGGTTDAASRATVKDLQPVEAEPVTLTRPDSGAVAFHIAAPAGVVGDDAGGDWVYRIEAERTACTVEPEPVAGTVAPGAVASAQWDLVFESDCTASLPHLVARVNLVRGDVTSAQPVLVYATASGTIRAACLGVATDSGDTCRTRGATVVIGGAPFPTGPAAVAEPTEPPEIRSEPVAARVVVNDAADGDDTVTSTPDADAVFGGSGDNTITVDAGDVVVGTGTDAVKATAGFVDVADGTPDDRVECTQPDAVAVIADDGDVIVGECELDTTPDSRTPGPTERGLLGNYTVDGTINLDVCTVPTCATPGYPPQIENPTVTVTLTDGRICTKNETGQGTYTVTSNGFKIPLSFTARNEWDSTCSFLLSGATWRIEVKSRNGKLLGAGLLYMGQFGRSYFAGADYIVTCGTRSSGDNLALHTFDDEGQLPPTLGCSRTKDLTNFRIVRTG